MGMRKARFILCLLAWPLSFLASPLLLGGPLTMSHSQGKFSDAEIEATIKAKLAKSKIGKDGFQVHVKDRVATWTGSTTVMQHKGAATRMAKAAGAIQVLNNIKVSDGAGLPVKGNPAGQPRHVQVKAAAQDPHADSEP
jgi:osmotically-inducible protein OsmY